MREEGRAMSAEELLASGFAALPDLIRAHSRQRPNHLALVEGDATLTYGALAAMMDRIAFALQRDGVTSGDAVAICARNSVPYAAAFCGILAAGAAVAALIAVAAGITVAKGIAVAAVIAIATVAAVADGATVATVAAVAPGATVEAVAAVAPGATVDAVAAVAATGALESEHSGPT